MIQDSGFSILDRRGGGVMNQMARLASVLVGIPGTRFSSSEMRKGCELRQPKRAEKLQERQNST